MSSSHTPTVMPPKDIVLMLTLTRALGILLWIMGESEVCQFQHDNGTYNDNRHIYRQYST